MDICFSDLSDEEIVGIFHEKLVKKYEKMLQKKSQRELRIEKIIKKKGKRLYVKWKGYDNSFNDWINISMRMCQYFSEPYKRSDGNMKIKLDLEQQALIHLHWYQK